VDVRSRSRSTISNRSEIVRSTEVRPRGLSIRAVPRTLPPKPTTATANESTAISIASTTAPKLHGSTSEDGRPGLPRAADDLSDTRPRRVSSPMSRLIVPRAKPVRTAISERESAPWRWISRTTAARLARRIVSLRCPGFRDCGDGRGRICATSQRDDYAGCDMPMRMSTVVPSPGYRAHIGDAVGAATVPPVSVDSDRTYP